MRVSEIYTSVQGEGPRVGAPTIFVRFGGCNLRCAGWPCDSQHAIDVAFRAEWEQLTPEEVYERIIKEANGKQRNVCFTGGEPFLQPSSELDLLINLLLHEEFNPSVIECFTNGTLAHTTMAQVAVSMIMDWKLPGSGEDTLTDTRWKNFRMLSYKDVVKFTIADRFDYDSAIAVHEVLSDINVMPQYYYGVVWGKLDNAELISWVLEDGLPWKFNMQIHNVVWDRSQRGI